MYTHKGWKVWETTGDLISMDTFHIQEGNTSYGYYCEDISSVFSYHWLSLVSWVILFILPPLLLSINILFFIFRTRCCIIIYSFPIYLLSSILSYITVGPAHYSIKTPTHFVVSIRASFINLFLTMAAVIILLSFISSSTNIIPVIILGSLFVFSAFITFIYIFIFSTYSSFCSCGFSEDTEKKKKLVWETVDPSKTAVKLKMLI